MWIKISNCILLIIFTFCFFFKQKTAYEMRISDWSSDVCSSDLAGMKEAERQHRKAGPLRQNVRPVDPIVGLVPAEGIGRKGVAEHDDEIGRASCRERVCQYV